MKVLVDVGFGLLCNFGQSGSTLFGRRKPQRLKLCLSHFPTPISQDTLFHFLMNPTTGLSLSTIFQKLIKVLLIALI